ncbi:calpain-B-like [Patiria miniata]|uniref:Uncharacterized protein n=1 Tax=Patiria miniata TaxID=46514 RepID=A0A914BCP8_PATMI|nr:calpain-B-like [Patiria miniata]
MSRTGVTYRDVKRNHNSSRLYEDPEFPAVDSSINYSGRNSGRFAWKRPKELCQDPKLFVGGASRFDVQGQLGNSWFVAGLAALGQVASLVNRVCPDDQDFDRNYCGAFYFKFWQYGKWVEVVVDDRLPTLDGKLVFAHSSEKNEFWSALLEKAYAKLHGSYEALKGGDTIEAMEDFTGGVCELHKLKDPPENLSVLMLQGNQRASLMACSIDANRATEKEAKLPNGLIMGHAYIITAVKKVTLRLHGSSQRVVLVRILDPVDKSEWSGRWSDRSREWSSVSESERRDMGLTFDADGEFWMEYSDFIREYSRLEMCHLGPGITSSRKEWVTNEIEGSWRRKITAGGSLNFINTFHLNPQIEVRLTEEDDEDEDDPAAKGCTLVIGLMQKNRRKQKEMGIENLTIGFSIYEYKDDRTTLLDKSFFQNNSLKVRSDSFLNTREMTGRFKLPRGRYCIIPSTFEPNKEGEFLIRIFTIKTSSSTTADEQTELVTTELEKPRSDDAVTARLHETFEKIAGADGELDVYELRDVLIAAYKNEFEGSEFSTDTCRAILAAVDVDVSGKLGFDEFKEVWSNLRQWKGVFKKYDQDNSGNFNSYELRRALSKIGFRVSNQLFRTLVLRYSNIEGVITFDDFLACVVKLKHLMECNFQLAMRRGDAYSLDEFLTVGMYS